MTEFGFFCSLTPNACKVLDDCCYIFGCTPSQFLSALLIAYGESHKNCQEFVDISSYRELKGSLSLEDFKL